VGSTDCCGGPLGNAQIKGRRDGSGEAFYAKSLVAGCKVIRAESDHADTLSTQLLLSPGQQCALDLKKVTPGILTNIPFGKP